MMKTIIFFFSLLFFAVTTKAQTSRYINDQNYYYYGILIESDSCECKCQSGEIMLEAREGRKYGYIVADDARFEILALNS